MGFRPIWSGIRHDADAGLAARNQSEDDAKTLKQWREEVLSTSTVNVDDGESMRCDVIRAQVTALALAATLERVRNK